MKDILKWYIRIFMFLLPIYFLPVMVDAFGVGKNWFFTVGALLGLTIWVIDLLVFKKNVVKFNNFFLVTLLLSAWSVVTWAMEAPGVQAKSLIIPMGLSTIIASTIWVFLWTQVTDKSEYKKQFNFVMASGVLVAITSLIVFLLPSSKFPLSLPSKDNALLTIGAQGWSLTGSLLSETVLFLFLAIEWFKRLVVKLKSVDEKTVENGSIETPYIREAVMVVLFGLVLFLDGYKMFKAGWVFLDMKSAWVIAVDTFKTSPIFGAGIGNFTQSFDLFRPVSFNATKYWSNTFNSSSMGLLHIWTELGVVGLVFMTWITALIVRAKKNTFFWQVLVLWMMVLFLPLNLMGLFLAFWLMAGVLFEHKEVKLILNVGEKNFNAMPWLLSVLLVAGIGFSGYISTRILMGEMVFKDSIMAAAKNDGTKTYDSQIKAIAWNPRAAEYRRIYSQTNLSLAKTILSNQNLKEEDKQKAATLIQQAVREAKAAISLDNKNPVYWTNLAVIYKDMIGLVDGAADWSFQAYNQAVALDPSNALLKLDLGGLLFAAEKYDDADRIFQQAVETKSDYANAWYNWAYTAKKQGKLVESVNRLENAVKLVPADSGDYEKATAELVTWKKDLEEALKKQQEALKQYQEQLKQAETLKAPEQKLPEATKTQKENAAQIPQTELQPPKQ